jgi:cell division protein FtsL
MINLNNNNNSPILTITPIHLTLFAFIFLMLSLIFLAYQTYQTELLLTKIGIMNEQFRLQSLEISDLKSNIALSSDNIKKTRFQKITG